MEEMFDDILDKCIDRINRGDKLEDCLAGYPEHAEELKPLLESMLSTTNACSYKPQSSARQRARQRFNAALRESDKKREKRRLSFPWIFGKTRAWALMTTVAVMAFVGYFGIMQLISQETGPGVITAAADPAGNFSFYISDAPIDDFDSLNMTFSMVRLLQEDGDWVEFVPETEEVDLTLLQGDLARQVWRGDVPEGEYTQAVLYVTGTSGKLTHSGKMVGVGSGKYNLSLDIEFEVASGSDEEPTEFVYDVTVISADSGYHLQSVPGESGTGRQIRNMDMQGPMSG